MKVEISNRIVSLVIVFIIIALLLGYRLARIRVGDVEMEFSPPSENEASPLEAAANPANTPVGPLSAVPAAHPDLITAIRLPVAPVIDGRLSEWSAAPAIESAFIVHSADGWDGSDDCKAIWRLAWDETNLYLAVDVGDNVHVQTQSGNQIFLGDSVELQLDTMLDGDFAPGLSPDDYQIDLSPGDFSTLSPSAYLFRGTAEGQILDAVGGNHVSLQAVQTETGYILEAAVPWSDLNISPAEGHIIGLALNANDNDTPGTAVQEVMKSHVASRTFADPTSWGRLVLR